MIKEGNKHIVLATLFGVYLLLVTFIFSAFDFLESPYSIWLYLLFILLSNPLGLLAYLYFVLKTKKEKGVNKILFSLSFISVGIVTSAISWIIFSGPKEHFFIYVSSFLIASFLPTLLSILYFIFQDTKEKIEQLGSVSLVDGKHTEGEQEKVFRLENANGRILLEVPISRIICFEANDNYVVTYYLKNDQDLAKSMERISLKKIEEMIQPANIPFFRVHKSYLINPSFVDEVKGRAQAYKIKMKFYTNPIPVSRSYDISTLPRY